MEEILKVRVTKRCDSLESDELQNDTERLCGPVWMS